MKTQLYLFCFLSFNVHRQTDGQIARRKDGQADRGNHMSTLYRPRCGLTTATIIGKVC